MNDAIDPAAPRTVRVDGADVAYHESGSGPALLLVHGGAPGATGWGNFGQNVPFLASRFRTIVVDLPGFGGSEWVPTPEGRMRAHAAVLVGLLERLEVPSAHVVGLGSGGAVAMRMALDHPERVDRLVLVSSAGGLAMFEPAPTEGLRAIRDYYRGAGPSPEKMRRYLEASIGDPDLITDDLVAERYRESVRPSVLEAAGRPSPGHPSDAVWKEADRIAARTLVVWGRENRVKGYDHGLFLASRIPDAELHLYSGAGLSVPLERARRFEHLVERFLTID
ncbi:alpha/beta fold hydrolase [Nocardioides sp. zg-ZUI104]|uniref:alpha/beta fold hydrolase n=1 Tax=Nocardioides faecalis TaxID=2803858 RepID=UPI001BCAF4A1|nr:alpha/beta hydrolase [Nocardioides faecalis]MBS4751272.1 alpha/beta fold hydrolase [Nocardioides faecalis]